MKPTLRTLATVWKAVVGFLAPAIVVLGSAVLDTSDGGSQITTAEWVTAAVAAVTTSVGVYTVRNRPKPPANGV